VAVASLMPSQSGRGNPHPDLDDVADRLDAAARAAGGASQARPNAGSEGFDEDADGGQDDGDDGLGGVAARVG